MGRYFGYGEYVAWLTVIFNPQDAQDLDIMNMETPLWRPQRTGIFSSSSRISLSGKRREMVEFQLMFFTGLLPPWPVFPHFAGWVDGFERG